jgi:hypothetical protein
MAAEAAPVIVVTRGIRIFKMRIILENEAERANKVAKDTSFDEMAQQRRHRPILFLLQKLLESTVFVTERYIDS